ncbi:acyl-protein synthase [Shewanella sp. VB17]|uniref:LuxE/PaaK family acyltransferase n=1 Tax=Shewanella sp. VB17 TaxID=2739432 RepID=UPI001565A978|nr:acyl-protein synthase [Shewanella sp. VB17]NRD75218.1 acyl-protein synthase [Shewanella sp. VB17]
MTIELEKVRKLCNIPLAYDYPADDLFIEAMQQILQWHDKKNPFFKRLLESKQFHWSQLTSIQDLEKIPFILANFFKYHSEKSIAANEVFLHLTSSGTGGQKSQMFFDEWSIGSAQKMVDAIFEYYGWVTPDSKVRYLLYSYEPESASKLGTSYTDNFLCQYAPSDEVIYALRNTGNDHAFDVFNVIDFLQRAEKDQIPVRIFGFPAFFHFTIERMKKMNIAPLKLHPQSLVFLGGGWKGHADQAIDKFDFYRSVNEFLGIPDSRLRDGFGSVEHCVPYVECENHQFHIPIWSHVLIRDFKTLEVKDYGEKGYLQFISPYITSMPAVSVLMADMATKHRGKECNCGLNTPYFVLHGRAGTSQAKSCAIKAADILQKEKL